MALNETVSLYYAEENKTCFYYEHKHKNEQTIARSLFASSKRNSATFLCSIKRNAPPVSQLRRDTHYRFLKWTGIKESEANKMSHSYLSQDKVDMLQQNTARFANIEDKCKLPCSTTSILDR